MGRENMKKKVLFVATVVKTHIMEFHIPFLKMFHDAGWETAVAAKNDYEDPADCQIPFCDHYYEIPFQRSPVKPGNLHAYRELKRVIDEGGYTLIHCHTPVGGILTRFAARSVRSRGTKVLYTAHGFHFFRGGPLTSWLLYFPAEWLCSFFTDGLITINQEDHRLAQSHLHPKKAYYVPGVGVNLDRIQRESGSREEVRRELGLRENDFFLLSVGEMTGNKNHRLGLEALAELKDPNIKYVIVGRGVQRESLERRCRELGLTDQVCFLGYRDDVARIYAGADAFFFPSLREGLPVSLMEAMASGLSSAVGEIRGNTDLIRDGMEGIYMPLTVSGAAKAIRRLADDPALRVQLGNAARKRVQAFSAQNVQARMAEIYRDAVDGEV